MSLCFAFTVFSVLTKNAIFSNKQFMSRTSQKLWTFSDVFLFLGRNPFLKWVSIKWSFPNPAIFSLILQIIDFMEWVYMKLHAPQNAKVLLLLPWPAPFLRVNCNVLIWFQSYVFLLLQFSRLLCWQMVWLLLIGRRKKSWVVISFLLRKVCYTETGSVLVHFPSHFEENVLKMGR